MADLIENCRRRRGMIGLLTVLGALLLGVRAQQQEFRLEGSDVTLVPKYTGDLRDIKWTLNDRILVEVMLKPQEEFIYNLPNDRTTINKTNGALTIRNLDRGDSGLYKAHVILMDDSIQVTDIRLTMRGCPDQPIISVESTKDQFVVSCKSFSPDVTYEWFNPTRSVSKNQSYAEPKKNGILTCVVDNKVCNKSSSINFYTSVTDQPEEKWVGDNVILVPKYTGDPSEIIWKVNGDKLVEMEVMPRVDTIFYRLQDRANISHTDGSLTIRDLTIRDYGDYTAVVLVNNEYYYTEIRLSVLKSSPLSGGDIAGIVIGVLAWCIFINFIILFLWYYCSKESSDSCKDDPIFLLSVVLSPLAITISIPIAILILWDRCCRRDDNNVENGNAAPAADGNIEGVNGVEDGNAVGENGDEDDDDDDKNVENGNAAPAADGNIEGVKGDKDDDVKKGIALVPMGENVDQSQDE